MFVSQVNNFDVTSSLNNYAIFSEHKIMIKFLIALVTGYCTQSDNVDGIIFRICLDVTLSTESYLQ